MRRSTAWSSAWATSLHSQSSAAFITVTAESNFRYTQQARRNNYLCERKSFTWKRAFSKRAISEFASTYAMFTPLTDVTASLTPGPALTVRRETSAVPISVNEPITFHESDCDLTAVVTSR